jgi:hypothetical protein
MVDKDLSSLSTTLTGVSGEYFVAAELSRRGLIASITLRNSRGIDILASDENAARTVSIQVKTNKTGSPKWVLSKKAEDYATPNHFYVFVILASTADLPRFYVVSSHVVAEHTRTTHQTWLDTPGLTGQAHKDNSARSFTDDKEQFRDRWDLLGF